MAKDIDRKLRVTAAVPGTIAMKDLGAAFRQINPTTSFNVDRPNKWVQDRSRFVDRDHPRDFVGLEAKGRRLANAGQESDLIQLRHKALEATEATVSPLVVSNTISPQRAGEPAFEASRVECAKVIFYIADREMPGLSLFGAFSTYARCSQNI